MRKHCLTHVKDFYWGLWNTKTGVEASDQDTESDLIHYQTENGLRHASGPVRLPLSTRYIHCKPHYQALMNFK